MLGVYFIGNLLQFRIHARACQVVYILVGRMADQEAARARRRKMFYPASMFGRTKRSGRQAIVEPAGEKYIALIRIESSE